MSRGFAVLLGLTLSTAILPACGPCEDNPEEGNYCEEITGPQAAVQSDAVSPEIQSVLRLSITATSERSEA